VGPSEDSYIVTELYDNTLRELLVERSLTEDEIQNVLSQILRGLMYLHSTGLVHGNVKPNTILAKTSFQKICRVLLSDFGCAGVLPFVDKRDKTMQKNYWAPERLLSGVVDFSVDIWAVGCIMAELLERKVQFCGADRADVVRSITLLLGTPSHHIVKKVYHCPQHICVEMKSIATLEPIDFSKRFPKTSPEGTRPLLFLFSFLCSSLKPCLFPFPFPGLDLLKRMLCYEPTKRISASGALGHPFLAKHRVLAQERVCTEFEPNQNPVSPGGWRGELLLLMANHLLST